MGKSQSEDFRGEYMRSRRLSKNSRQLKNKYTNMAFQWLAITYLLFCIAFQLTSPTTAHFNDIETVRGTLSTADVFDEDKNQTRTADNTHKTDNTKGVNSSMHEKKDKKTADQSGEQRNGPSQKEGNRSSGQNEGQKDTGINGANQTVKPDSSDQLPKTESKKANKESENVKEKSNTSSISASTTSEPKSAKMHRGDGS